MSKGPRQVAPYAVRMQQARRVLANEERAAIVHHCLTTIYQAAAVALNEQFGFGPERVERFRDTLNAVMLDFGVLQDDTDTDYAMGALERRYKQIMERRGSDAKEEPPKGVNDRDGSDQIQPGTAGSGGGV